MASSVDTEKAVMRLSEEFFRIDNGRQRERLRHPGGPKGSEGKKEIDSY